MIHKPLRDRVMIASTRSAVAQVRSAKGGARESDPHGGKVVSRRDEAAELDGWTETLAGVCERFARAFSDMPECHVTMPSRAHASRRRPSAANPSSGEKEEGRRWRPPSDYWLG